MTATPGPVDPLGPPPGTADPPTPAVVSLHVWGVADRHVPSAVVRMARHRRPARGLPGVTFAKLLGTGSARTFTPRDADARHWGMLLCWSDSGGPTRFADSPIAASWDRIADESATWLLRPITSTGRWAGRQPFGDPIPQRWDGPVAAITRGRIKPSHWRAFWAAVPPVALDVRDGGGLTFALGIGEAPIGLQGTFSTWTGNAALRAFAYQRGPHQAVIAQTRQRDWYAEELFARFALLAAAGSHDGHPVTTTPPPRG
ncbi:MAG: hypothetical protein MUF35_08500 [Candidatus Nanopelagicales bacterium]|nr:hypothetical protein [Candidatus Nanopelagicales bacterium]